MNKKLLRSEMILHDDTNSTLANALGISPQSLSSKMNETNGAEFTQMTRFMHWMPELTII